MHDMPFSILYRRYLFFRNFFHMANCIWLHFSLDTRVTILRVETEM